MKLKYKSDIRTIVALGIYLLTAGLSYYYFTFTWYIFIPMVIWNCVMAFIVTVTVHNTVHVPIFKSQTANKIFQIILSIGNGHPVTGFVSGHNLSHHKHLLTPKDLGRPSQVNYKYNLLNQLFFSFNIVGKIANDERRFVLKMMKLNPRWARQYFLEFLAANSIKISCLILNPWAALFTLYLPHIYSNWGILGTNYWQHDGCDPNHDYNHSRSFTGKFFNYIAFNNGYHGAHHHKANLHWSLLPEYNEKYIKPNTHPNLQLDNFLKYLIKTYLIPGKRVDYLGNPLIIVNEPDGDWVADIETYTKDMDEEMGGVFLSAEKEAEAEKERKEAIPV